jgi:hypothetical protein
LGSSDWRLLIASTLFYALAFNLIFFIQELFLVLPKALTPGLSATLFHNNHSWTGDQPLARLFQGTGAAAILLVGITALGWLRRRPPQTTGGRLFLIWVAYHGLFESLPQVVVGAFWPPNDVGMAMDYLRFSPFLMQVAALAALAAIGVAGRWLPGPLLSLAADPAQVDHPQKRARFIFRVATLPALLAIGLIIPFRLPGSIEQVLIVPVAVTLIGISWLQASAWRSAAAPRSIVPEAPPLRTPLAALLVLLLFFQLILRPGISF